MRYAAIDIGNVCISIDKTAPLRGMGLPPDDSTLQEIHKCVQRFEFGITAEEEFFSELSDLAFCRGESVEKLKTLYDSILVAPVAGMKELLEELPALGVMPVFFSDISTFHLEGSRVRMPLMREYEGIYSFNYGVYKPSPVLFKAFEDLYGKPVIYADDRADLITEASRYGWNAHLFTSSENLRREITKLLHTA